LLQKLPLPLTQSLKKPLLTQSSQKLLQVSLPQLLLSFYLPQLSPYRDLTMYESTRDASSKVLIENADVGKQHTHKRWRWGPHPQACGVNKLLCVVAARNVWYNGRRGKPGGEEGHERGGEPEEERNERMGGPEEGRARRDQ
jgi:hypothetical protein